MKKNAVKFITLFSIIALLTSCVKDQSTVEGKVNYTGAISGTSYIAEQADVVLVDELSEDMRETTTNSEGYYSFENVIDGKYHVYAEIYVNVFLYIGTSNSFWVEGDEVHSENLQLYY